MHAPALIVLYVIVLLTPLGIAWLSGYAPRSVPDELASGMGMLAFSALLAEFVLSGRFRTVSARIGMDVTMRMHQLFARSLLVLALVHPFLYASPFASARPWDGTLRLTLQFDVLAMAGGTIAWVLLALLVLVSIARDELPYTYESWRLAHGLGAVVIAALVLHHSLTIGRYSQVPALVLFWAVMFALACLTVVYVYLIGPLRRRNRPWTVTSVRPVGLKTWEVAVAPEGHSGLRYKAGQFAWLNLGHSPFSLQENPFSISSAPASGPGLQFVIKELGDFTRTVGTIRTGTRAYIDGPHGNLVVQERAEPGLAFIAGGVGVAPLLGILRQLRADGDDRPWVLIYGNRCKEQIIYPSELESLSAKHGTRIVHVLSEPETDWTGDTGMVDATPLAREFSGPSKRDWLYVLCGPPPMMDSVEEALIKMGVSRHRILSEKFKYD
ncbi:MAG: ferredoxin reductase family protein [Pseudomonadota bacterium]